MHVDARGELYLAPPAPPVHRNRKHVHCLVVAQGALGETSNLAHTAVSAALAWWSGIFCANHPAAPMKSSFWPARGAPTRYIAPLGRKAGRRIVSKFHLPTVLFRSAKCSEVQRDL
jgi:hypothetical protein